MMEWLSGFLFNPALAAGTAAVASPILIHLFSRRRFRRVRWAAMAFLLDAQRKNRRRVRIEQLILLFLRCLAVFLIAMMIARPFVRPSLAASLIGAAPRTERIVLIDDSYSMAYRPEDGGAAVFEDATRAAETLARWIAGESPQDVLTLLTTRDPRSSSLSLPSLSEEHLRRLHDHLQTLAPSQQPSRMADALVAVADLIRRAPVQTNTAVYVISDFQRHDWVRVLSSEDEAPRSVIAPLADAATDSDRLTLALIDVGAAAPRNVAMTAVIPLQPQCIAGIPARFEIAVANHTPTALTDVELSVAIARHGVGAAEAPADGAVPVHALPPVLIPRVAAGQVVREPIEVTFPGDGSDFLEVELAGSVARSDGLRVDNRRSVAVAVAAAVNVLIVDGQPSNDPYRDEVYLLRTALRPAGRVASGNDVTVIDESELDSVDLDGAHCVILANVYPPNEAARRNIERYVRGGGGLILFVGDQVDPDIYNRQLFDGGRGLLPAALDEVVQTPVNAEPVTFGDWDTGEPMLRAFVDDLAVLLRQVRIDRFVTVEEAVPDATGATTRPAAPRSERTTREKRPPAVVLARFSDGRRSPALIRRAYGRGSVLFVATTADQAWNDWAGNFSYVPVMLEMVLHMARRSEVPEQVPVGEPIVCGLDATEFQTDAAVRPPGYPLEPEIAMAATLDAEGHAALRFKGTSKAGLYRFMLTRTTGEPVVRYAAVNPDPVESNPARIGRIELEESLVEMDFDFVEDPSVFQEGSAGARREMWWPLLVWAVGVLMAEHTLAWWFGRRG